MKIIHLVSLTILSLFSLSLSIFAQEASPTSNYITNTTINEKIDNDLYLRGKNIIVDAEIKDNGYLTGQKISILKRIGGNLWVFAKDLEIGGIIRKSLYAIATSVTIKDQVGGDIFVLAQDIKIYAPISGGAYLLGEDVFIDADLNDDTNIVASRLISNHNISDDLNIKADQVYLNGEKIDGDVQIQAKGLSISQDLEIEGKLIFNNKEVQKDEFRSSNNPESFEELPNQSEIQYLGLDKFRLTTYAGMGIFWLLFILGDVISAYLIFKLFPAITTKAITNIGKIKKNLLIGISFVLITILTILISIISIIGLPISYLMILILLLVLQISKYIGFYKLGSLIINKIQPKVSNVILNCFIGELAVIAIILLLIIIPVVGEYLVIAVAILYSLITVGSLTDVNLSLLRANVKNK